MKKRISLLLSLLLLLPVIAACGPSAQPPAEGTEEEKKDPVQSIQITLPADAHERLTYLANTVQGYLQSLGYTVTVSETPAAEEIGRASCRERV